MSHDPESEANDPMATWMRKLANDPMERSHRPLPDPDLLWMKAQLLNRQAAAERSMRPIRWVSTIARLLVGFAACWLAMGLTKVFVVPAIGFLNPTLIKLAVSLVLAAAAMVAFPIWSED
jgi:hypothetical protein